MDDRIWAEIEAAGPRPDAGNFDPLVVDDVLAAERAATQYDRRRAFIASYAWAIPTRNAIEHIATALGDLKLLEVGAGIGLWAKLLSDAGVSVIATDGVSPLQKPWFDIEVAEAAAAVESHRDCRALFLCWPAFKDSCAHRALTAFEGDLLVYAGDVRFTGDAQFHALLDEAWSLTESIPLPSWPGTADGVHIYARA